MPQTDVKAFSIIAPQPKRYIIICIHIICVLFTEWYSGENYCTQDRVRPKQLYNNLIRSYKQNASQDSQVTLSA